MSQTNYSRYKYTPDEMSEEDFLSRFVVRTEIFEDIFEDIKSADYNVPNQHHIIIGQRGQGKTTLLRKLSLEIQKDDKLSKFLLPVKLTEEQYQIRSLCRLWEEVADYIQTMYESDFGNILDDMEQHFEDEDYDFKCFSYLENTLKSKEKKVLLLIDNIDELLGKLKEKEQRRLREILLTSSSFRIIGGSTKMIEQHFNYAKPFYEFFKIIKLNGLNYEDCISFLRSIGKDEEKEKIESVIVNSPQRIETLRRLTGGVPRTLVMLFDIFIDEDGDAFEDLLKILDEATPLYKHRMDDLPPILQDIVHTIALNWDGITTKEIAKKTRLESKSVSSQLKQLEKYEIIEFDYIGKNKIYKIQERFFNIWYLMRFGRKKDRHRVEWLVKFLVSWCDNNEIEERTKKFIESIKNGKVHASYAYHMCEALSYAGSNMKIEGEMKKYVKEYLNTINSKLKNELSISDAEVLKQAMVLYDKKDIDNALKTLLNSKKGGKEILFLISILYQEQDKLDKAEEYSLKAIESGHIIASEYLANIYVHQNKLDKAEEYYLRAIENGNTEVLSDLANLYDEQDNFDKAELYYLKAIESGDTEALNDIGVMYTDHDKLDKAEEYYLKAIENDDNHHSLRNLAIIYEDQDKLEKAEEYYLRAIESGSNQAISNLGNIYEEQNKFDKAEEYYLKAIESGDTNAINDIGVTYAKQGKLDKAEKYFLSAIENGNTEVLRNLGLLYEQQYKHDKAEKYYLKAIESGDTESINNLAFVYEKQSKYDKAEEYYLKAIKNGNTEVFNDLGVIYAKQDKFDKAEKYFLKALESGNNSVLRNFGIMYEKQDKFDKAEKYYLKSIESGDTESVNNLELIYEKQNRLDKIEEYYLKAIESGNTEYINNLAFVYEKQNKLDKAEEYYLKDIENGNNNSLNTLSWLYFEQAENLEKSMKLICKSNSLSTEHQHKHTLAIIQLWAEEFSNSYNSFLQWLEFDESIDLQYEITLYLNLLIAKGQFYKAKEFFEINEYDLKNRYKPIWFALMSFMEKDFPNEVKKMGSELKESVDEVIEEINNMKIKYKL